jgi:hypothetical protein
MTGQSNSTDNQIWEVNEMDMVPFCFEGMTLKEACWLKGHPYFTRKAIGEWLGAEHPQRYIGNIVDRNPHIKTFSTGLNLSLVENGRMVSRKVEAYDPIGLQLIINKSDLPKAIAFQVAAAHLVYSYIKGELKPSKWVKDKDFLSAARQILSMSPGFKRGEMIRDLAEVQGCTPSTIYRRIELATGERLKTKKGKPIHRVTKGQSQHPEEKEKVLAYAKINPSSRGTEIKNNLGISTPYSTINSWLRSAKNKGIQ